MDGVDTMTTPRAERNFDKARMENLLFWLFFSSVRSFCSVCLGQKAKVVE